MIFKHRARDSLHGGFEILTRNDYISRGAIRFSRQYFTPRALVGIIEILRILTPSAQLTTQTNR